jgi:hypothetical protein
VVDVVGPDVPLFAGPSGVILAQISHFNPSWPLGLSLMFKSPVGLREIEHRRRLRRIVGEKGEMMKAE